ncbi:MAG: amidohydrolase family protein [Proteobacteria bacterium]|nr:amidohydrolase family protein [Pseudomonadota bacterium]
MNKILILLSVGFMASSSFAASKVLIQNVTVISPERSSPLENAFVLMEGDRILTIGQGAAPTVVADTQTVDGRGKFLIPGLIDAHVHLMAFPGMSRPQEKKFSEIASNYKNQMPRSYLYYGYTTLIDLAVIDRTGINNFKNSPVAPDVYDCDQPVPLANGYPTSYVEPEDRFEMFKNFLYDPRQKESIPSAYKASDHTAKAAVERVKKGGGICVKTHYEPGFDGKKLPTPTKAMLTDLARETHAAGMKLIIHANSLEAQSFALSAPPDIFAHGMWNWGKLQKQPGLPAKIRGTLDKIAKNNIGYMPTFQVLDGTRALFDPKYLDSPDIKKVIPADLLAWYRTKDGQWFADLLRKEIKLSDDFIATANKKRMVQLGLTVNYLLSKQGRLLFGTDTPSAPTYGNLPGWNGYLEMQRWNEAKVPLGTMLRSATLTNAESLGLEKDIGSIVEGKKANLLLLNKNPLLTVDAYDSIDSIILRGRVVPRNSLLAD